MANTDEHVPGEVFREYDPYSSQQELYRFNRDTGIRETLVQGVIVPYWQEASRVLRDEYGNTVDFEG